MKIKTVEFRTSAPALSGAPQWAWPEFAFIGRSNVGKSSIINMLSERSTLAKVSDLPGKTKLMNFFVLNGNWSLVDLPGYGYAKVAQQDKREFNVAVADYIEQRENLACVFVLIDSRLEPQQIDLDFVHWISGVDVSFALIFTKADKQSAGATADSVARFKQRISEFNTELPPVFVSSSKTKLGRMDVLKFIEAQLAEWKKAQKAGADEA